jgi:hypothetical protein
MARVDWKRNRGLGGNIRGEVRNVGMSPNGFNAQFLDFDGRDLDYDFLVTKRQRF